jgi:Rod binding domain-containing protein
MGGVSEYKGLRNQDIRPLSGGARKPSQEAGTQVFNVEELRQGATGDLRGRGYVPESYRAAHSDKGLSEGQRVAKLQKIRDSAQEYEGMLMTEMIKLMRQSPLTKTAGSDTYSEIAEKPFTAALAAAGGLGLADKIVEDVARQEGLLGTLEEHPEIMGPNWRARISPSRMYKPAGMAGDGQARAGEEGPQAPPGEAGPEAGQGMGKEGAPAHEAARGPSQGPAHAGPQARKADEAAGAPPDGAGPGGRKAERITVADRDRAGSRGYRRAPDRKP